MKYVKHIAIPFLKRGFADERPLTHSVPSVIPAKVNPVRKELITAVTKTTTEIFQAADEITPLTLVAAARRTLTADRLTPVN